MRATIDWPGTDAATDEAGGLRPGRVGQNKWPKSATYRNRAVPRRSPHNPRTGPLAGIAAWPTPACGPRSYHIDERSISRVPGGPTYPILGALRENANPLLPFVSLKAMRVGVIEPTAAVDE